MLLTRHKQLDKNEPLQTLGETREVGIVYDVKSIDTHTLTKTIHYFEAEGKNVITLGFVDEKELGEYVSNYKNEYFCKKDLRFWKIPKKPVISRFITKEFDYLINLDCIGRIELQAISTYSKAKTRIGKHFDEFSFSQDFMIKSVAKTEEELFDDLKKYLK